MYVPDVPKSKDSDPLERWRHFESKYAERLAPVMEGDGVVGDYVGGYTDWQRYAAQQAALAA